MNPNDPAHKSFIETPAGSDFPIQNLPFGAFSTPSDPHPRIGVAIGDFILDLAVIEASSLLPKIAPQGVFNKPVLNDFMALGPAAWSGMRAAISQLLRHDNPHLRDDGVLRQRAFVKRNTAKMHLP
ncbi:MAG: fumarylacetoacetase, partial [Alphaproteobacteria bacterium]|nr:fumarylacetoacetase [Alphaproteobacteria bacterium]